MDIEKCYDSVDVRSLQSFLHRTDLLDKEYYLLNCVALRRKNNIISARAAEEKEPFKNHFRHKFHKLGIDGGEYPSL